MEKENRFLKADANKMDYALLAAVLTMSAVLLIFYFVERLPGQRWIFLFGDLKDQYIAFSPLFWRSLLSGEGIGYTFYVSLGMPSIPLYTGSSLSPFNLLYLLIDHAELATVILVVLKLSLAAYSFQRFSARVLKNDSLSSVIFSMGYALNGYCIVFYFNIHLLDGVYMLPIIFMLVAEAVKKRRFTKLTLAYAYLFAVEFYGGYIIGFFSLLFFILLLILEYKKEWKNYISTMIGFGISVICAALIGAAFLYPTAVFLLNNRGIQDTDLRTFTVHIWDVYKNLYIGQYHGRLLSLPYIYCGTMTLYLLPCFFADRSVKRVHKLLALVILSYLLICSLWFPGYMFMHCFDYPDGYGFRFAYLYPFTLMSIGCLEWKHMEAKRSWELILLFIIQTVLYFAVNISGKAITVYDKIFNTVFLLIFLVLFLLFRKYGAKKLFQGVFLGLVCIELIINGILVGNKLVKPLMETRDVYRAFSDINRQAIDSIKAHDNSFYRIAQENIFAPNDSSLHSYYGLTYFSSIENSRVGETLGALGYAKSARISSDYGGTPLTRMLLAQKYEVIVNSADYVLGRVDNLWIENDRFLTLGYMVSNEILDIDLNSDNAFENQNSVASGMTGQTINVFVPYGGEITGVTNNMVLYWDEQINAVGFEPGNELTESSLTFYMDDMGMPLYAYFAQDESYSVEDSVYFISGVEDGMRLWTMPAISLPQIIDMDKDDDGRYYVKICYDEIHSNNNYYKESYFYCYDDAAVDRVYELLKDNQMNILEMKGSDITAEIEVPADKHILFTSIPYDEGWHVLVDGKEIDTLAVVNDTFLAVQLEEGHHELEFYYDSDINRIGAVLSLTGVILYVGIILIERRRIGRSEEIIMEKTGEERK